MSENKHPFVTENPAAANHTEPKRREYSTETVQHNNHLPTLFQKSSVKTEKPKCTKPVRMKHCQCIDIPEHAGFS